MGLPIRLDALGERLGPLPVWGWAGIAIAGGVAVVMLMPRRAKGPTMAATAPSGPEMPLEPQGVPGYQDSSYGGSGSYTAVQTYVCPDGRVSFDPSQCHTTPPGDGGGNPPPPPIPGGDRWSRCNAQYPLKRFPPGSKGGSWSGAHPLAFWDCIFGGVGACSDLTGEAANVCKLATIPGSQYILQGLDATGNLVRYFPHLGSAGQAPGLDYSGEKAGALPLQGYRYAMPDGNPRGTGI